MKKTIFVDKITKLVAKVPIGTCIVELGTHHGISAVLYNRIVGGKIDIFTIDDFDLERPDWLGQCLKDDDELIFYENIKKSDARIIACRMKIEDAVKRWIRAIGLLSWDIGRSGRFRRDFDDWSKFVIVNGVVIVKDTSGNKFGTFEVIEELVENLEWEKFDYMNGVSFLRKLR